MSRDQITASNLTALQKPATREALFVDLEFPSGPLYATTAGRVVTWGGKTYDLKIGIGDVQGLTESTDAGARNVTIELDGVNAALKQKIIADAYHYAVCRVYHGFFDEDWQLVADPIAICDELYMSQCVLTLESGSAGISISAETSELLFMRDSSTLATPESQRKRYTGDTGLDHVASLPAVEIEWGGKVRGAAAPGGAGAPAPARTPRGRVIGR